jgi:hypothetical protein
MDNKTRRETSQVINACIGRSVRWQGPTQQWVATFALNLDSTVFVRTDDGCTAETTNTVERCRPQTFVIDIPTREDGCDHFTARMSELVSPFTLLDELPVQFVQVVPKSTRIIDTSTFAEFGEPTDRFTCLTGVGSERPEDGDPCRIGHSCERRI